MKFKYVLRFAICWMLLANVAFAQQDPATAKQETQEKQKPDVQKAELGKTTNVHVVGNIFLAGQFTPEDISEIQKAGIERVITLRTDGELNWNEQQVVEEAKLEFESVPISGPDSITDETFDEVCVLLKGSTGKTLLHCGSATRVGCVWIAHRVLNENIPLKQARQEALEIGLRSPAYEEKAIAYVKKKLAEKSNSNSAAGEDSVRPGINSKFLDPELDPEDWVKRFELESREIYNARKAIVGACEIPSGARVADIGAGTGLFTRQFSEIAGSKGWVYAVDISPRLVEHINRESAKLRQANVTGVLCREDSICLPPDSIDVAFICDTYHHFEYPESSLASIHRALAKGGKLVLIDFKRIPGKSREWTLNHVRAGKETFQQEIEAAGFEKTSESIVPGLGENYFLTFRKK